MTSPSIAVLIPCFNESATIGKVISDFQNSLPSAVIYVYDNNSTDDTASISTGHDAEVVNESLQGKGHVVRRMFSDIQADVYVLVDGDDTYDAGSAPVMVSLLLARQLDMVTAVRESNLRGAYRTGHRFGNALLSGIVISIFGRGISDMLSGYRVFTRRFVKSFPAFSSGFETETEFSVHALDLRMPIGEVASAYGERPTGSVSKLKTYSDGFRILHTIFILVKEQRPLQFFSSAGALLIVLALIISAPIMVEYIETGLVPRFPTAILSTGLIILAFLSFTCGLILDSVSRGRREIKRIAYLGIPLFRSKSQS